MRSLLAFFKKELLETVRSGKLLILLIIFCVIGIMNPAVAKLTPRIVEMLSEELADSGMIVVEVKVDAITSWTQFFKNIPIALIAFVFIYGGSFAREYESSTLILILTKGLARYKVIVAKASLMLLLWTAGYWICFLITYGYNAYFWDNSIATGLFPAVINWWLFGVLVIALTVFFSVVTKGYSTVLLGVGGVVLASYIAGLIPKIAKYLPTALMNSATLLVGGERFEDYLAAFIITAAASVVLIGISIPILNKKQI